MRTVFGGDQTRTTENSPANGDWICIEMSSRVGLWHVLPLMCWRSTGVWTPNKGCGEEDEATSFVSFLLHSDGARSNYVLCKVTNSEITLHFDANEDTLGPITTLSSQNHRPKFVSTWWPIRPNPGTPPSTHSFLFDAGRRDEPSTNFDSWVTLSTAIKNGQSLF